MNCTVVKDLLAPYVDMELSGETQAQIDNHIADCDSCRIELQAQLGVHRLLSEKLEKVKADEDLRNRIVKNTVGDEARQSFWLFKKLSFEMRPAAGFAAAAALIIIAFSAQIFNFGDQQYPNIASDSIYTFADLPGVDGLKATVTGELICVGCYLRENYNADFQCELHGHKLALLGNDGSIWSFTDNDDVKNLVSNIEMKGKKIKIDGNLYYNAHFIDVENYSILDE